jgi:hypothetical protein
VTAPQPPAAPKRGTLSRDLADFLIDFSIALHKHAMYPEGHPSLEPAAAGVVRRAGQLLEDRATLSLGVARQQLIIEGVATDPKHPVLAELAGRLHRHHLGAVTFERGVATPEVADLLRTLAVEADRTGQPLGLGAPERLRAWPHVRLHPLTYEKLELLEDTPAPAAAEAGEDAPLGAARGVRSAQLWLGLARAALAGQLGEGEEPPTKPAAVAQAIDAHARGGGEGYDQVIVGYLLQIADELKQAGGAEAADLRRRTSRLVGALRPETLRRLIEMGGDAVQRQRFIRDATDGMAVDAVLELVQAAADTSHQTISHSLVRMLSKLAAHAEQGAAGGRALAEAGLRDQVRELLAGWTLDDPNPGEYGAALQRMSRAAPVFAAPKEAAHGAEALRLVQMAVEMDTAGPMAWKAVATLAGRLGELLDVLDQAPGGNSVAREIWLRMARREVVQGVLQGPAPDLRLLDRLLPHIGLAAAGPMLDALAEAEVRATRRHLLDRLARLGEPLGPMLVPRLTDPRWYVVRNLLYLLAEIPRPPEGFSPAAFAVHADSRVRREAIKLQLKVPAERERAVIAALADDDEQMVRIALVTALQECPAPAVPAVAGRATGRGGSPELRVLAIRVLGRSRAPAALEALLRITDGGRTLLRRRKLAAKSPELLAALIALSGAWTTHPTAASVLARAARSKDPEVRAAAAAGAARR